MSEYCGSGIEEGDAGEWQSVRTRIYKHPRVCDDCGKQYPAGSPFVIWTWRWYEDNTRSQTTVCEACDDLFESLREANHEPMVGQATMCARESAALLPFRRRVARLTRLIGIGCWSCRHFNRTCQHDLHDEFNSGENTYTTNDAECHLRNLPSFPTDESANLLLGLFARNRERYRRHSNHDLYTTSNLCAHWEV